jgi:hypothetical protein
MQIHIQVRQRPFIARFRLGLLTLGVAPVAATLSIRNWPKAADSLGLTAHGGRFIKWRDFAGTKKIVTVRNHGGFSTRFEHFELLHPKREALPAPYRLVNGGRALNFIWQNLPEETKRQAA